MDTARIRTELMRRGASRYQAATYLMLCTLFETLSVGRGDKHHALPKQCGWWKRYAEAKWNHVRVAWALHICLHAYLFYLFPLYPFAQALRAVTLRGTRTGSTKKIKHRDQAVAWYRGGKSTAWIAKRSRVHSATVARWLNEALPKEERRKLRVEHSYQEGKIKRKDQIILWFKSGVKPKRIARRIGASTQAVRNWLKEWLTEDEYRAHTNHASEKRIKRKAKVIAWYREGRTFEWIGRRIGSHPTTVRDWILLWVPKEHRNGEKAWELRKRS